MSNHTNICKQYGCAGLCGTLHNIVFVKKPLDTAVPHTQQFQGKEQESRSPGICSLSTENEFL